MQPERKGKEQAHNHQKALKGTNLKISTPNITVCFERNIRDWIFQFILSNI